jgi:hypothetical protein
MQRRAHRIGWVLAAGLVASLVVMGTGGRAAFAADQTVTSTLDDGSPGTLRAAIDATNASGGGTITIAVSGTITLTSALPTLTQNTTIVGAGAGQTVIDTAGYRFVHSVSTIAVVVTDLTLTGHTSSALGSMIHRENGTTTLERVEISGNIGAYRGIIHQKQRGVFHVVDSTVHDNTGAVFGSDHGNTPGGDTIASPLADTSYDNRIYVSGTAFSDNAGCVIQAERFVSITGSTFTANSGVCLNGLNRKTIVDSTFSANGTAVALSKNAAWNVPVILDGVTITGNTVGVSGAYTTTAIDDSTICQNSVDLTERSDALNPQTIVITDSDVGASCPPPPTTTTTTTTTSTTTTSTAPTTTVTTTAAPTTTTSDPSTTVTSATPTTEAPTTTTNPGTASTGPTTTTGGRPSPLEPPDLSPVVGVAGGGARSIDSSGAVGTVDVVVAAGRHVLTSGATSVSITGPHPSQPGSTLTLPLGATVEIEGTGYLGGSAVKAWLFSEPTLLHQVVVEDDGSFRIVADLPASAGEGSHTVVVSGVRADGVAEAMAMPVGVTGAEAGPTGALPFTGSHQTNLLAVGTMLVLLGALLVIRARTARPSARP